jgi:putative transposase
MKETSFVSGQIHAIRYLLNDFFTSEEGVVTFGIPRQGHPIKSVSRNTVKAILKENGLDPGPQRGRGTWDNFLKIHAATLWQCDFFSKKVLTPKGLRDIFVLVFLHVETRRVFVTPATFKTGDAWMREQAEAFVQHVKDSDLKADIVMHDRESKFTADFDQTLRDAKLRVQKAAYRSPNTVAFVERFIQTMQQECLDYFIVFGERHMNHLVKEMVAFYHESRPHQAKDNDLLVPDADAKTADEPEVLRLTDVRCKERLGGVLKHYYRKAA